MLIPRTWFRLSFPSDVNPDAALAFLRSLQGASTPGRRETFLLQAVGHAHHVDHWLAAPRTRATAAQAQARALLPGLVLAEDDWTATPPLKAAWRLWMSTSRRPLASDQPELLSQSVLAALADVGDHESVVLQWVLGPVRRPIAVSSQHGDVLSESWPIALASAPLLGPKAVDAEARTALRNKQGLPGWRAIGRIAVAAASREDGHALLGRIAGALRVAEGPGVRLGVRPIPVRDVIRARTPLVWPIALSTPELLGLMAWPLGEVVGDLPVARRHSRLLPAPRNIPTQGRVVAYEPSTDRPLALSATDSLQHLHLLGPTGSGKSTAMLGLITQDMVANRSVVLIEPKGDLITAVLQRVPEHRRDDVVVLRPTDTRPLGFNPLRGPDPELAADQILGIFQRLNRESWGPRLAQVLHAGLLTLAKSPDTSLVQLPLLLLDSGFRRGLVSGLDDPFGVSPFWASYERLSPEARTQVIAPVLNKLDPILFRSALRGVLGQTKPRFDLAEVFTRPRILLVDLAKGALGPVASQLLGTLLLNQLANLIYARAGVPEGTRRPVMLFIDEFQDFAAVGDLAELLSQSRGLGAGFTIAHQFLGQLTPELRAAVLSQARSRMLFQLTYDDASVMARGHRELSPEDLAELPAYEAYLRLVTGSEVSRYLSGRTRPASEPTTDAAALRAASRGRYGVPRSDTDAALRRLLGTSAAGAGPVTEQSPTATPPGKDVVDETTSNAAPADQAGDHEAAPKNTPPPGVGRKRRREP